MKPRRILVLGVFLLFSAAFLSACSQSAPDIDAMATAAAGVEPQAEHTVTADNMEFDTDTIVVPVLSEIRLTLINDDAGALHNISIYRGADSTHATHGIFIGALGTGPDIKEYVFAAPPEGVYFFKCDAHPEMNGAFISR